MSSPTRKCPPITQTITSAMHYDGKRLIPWAERPEGPGTFVLLRTNQRGDRTLIEQTGHPIPPGLAEDLRARVKPLKRRQ